MKLNIYDDSIFIVPETPQDIAYMEHIMGFKNNNKIIVVVKDLVGGHKYNVSSDNLWVASSTDVLNEAIHGNNEMGKLICNLRGRISDNEYEISELKKELKKYKTKFRRF